jgi:ribonuclease P protein component
MPGDAPAVKTFSLPKSHRLQKTWEFEKVRREGQRLVKGCLILNWRIVEGQKFCRLGIISSRKIGNAVVRSRARRLIREVFRLHRGELSPASDLIFIARPSIQEKGYSQVEKDFLLLTREAKLRGNA